MKRLTLPLSDEETRVLRAGEGVLLSGPSIRRATARTNASLPCSTRESRCLST